MINKDLFIYNKEQELFKKMKENLYFNNEIQNYLVEFYEKEKIPDLLGKSLRVNDKQFSGVNKIKLDLCTMLELDNIEIYVYEDFYYGVESKGINKKWLEISSKTIEDFNNKQLKFIIAKELYNIKFGNTKYSSIIMRAIQNIESINIPGSNISLQALKISMFKWHRAMNFSSDNFGLIVCGNIRESIDTILLTIFNNKYLVSNINLNEYIKQADEINKLDDIVYNNTKLDELVPYGPFRVKNLIAYYSSLRAKEAKRSLEIKI